jgi:uncharacterized repeat protein (TIGR02543 family)
MRPSFVPASIIGHRTFGLRVVVRSCLSILFATLIVQGAIPIISASATTPLFHSVTFVENDNPNDPVYSTQTANTTTPLTAFANMNPAFVNSGYSYVGWNTSPDGSGTSFANGSTFSFTSAETLYAIWTSIDHSVTFVENDSSTDPLYAIQTDNAPASLTSFANLTPTLTNPGFTFVDWNTEPSGGGVAISDGSTYSFSAAIDLYAIWSPVPTSTLNFATASGTGSVPSISDRVGGSTTLPTGAGISNPGYTFIGWNTAANGSGTEYAAGATYVFSVNQTLYAQWSPDTYVVNFAYDGGVASVNSANYVVGTAALTLPTPTFAGSTFDGWFDASSGGSLVGAGGATYVPSNSVQLFAQWTLIIIDVISFNVNGGSGSIASYSGDGGSSTVLPSSDGISMPGYSFSGWNTNADGSGTMYAEGANLTLSGSQTFFAQWTAGPSVTVSFDANGGSGSIVPINGTPGSTITLPDQSGLIHAGYELTKWNTSATGSGTSYPIGQGFTLAGSEVLYAQWSGHKLPTLFGAIGTFKSRSSSLSMSLKRQISRIAITIRSRKYRTIDLFGYTAATGLKSLNVSLSRDRAKNVEIYLRSQLSHFKVKGVKILSTGEGAISGQTGSAYSRVEVFGV